MQGWISAAQEYNRGKPANTKGAFRKSRRVSAVPAVPVRRMVVIGLTVASQTGVYESNSDSRDSQQGDSGQYPNINEDEGRGVIALL